MLPQGSSYALCLGRPVLGASGPGASDASYRHLLWRRRFDGRPVVGSTISVNGIPSTIIGIMPPGFCFPDRAQLWQPLSIYGTPLDRAGHNSWAVARLNTGRTIEDARTEMQGIGRQLASEYPEFDKDVEPLVMPLHDVMVETDTRVAVLASMAAVGFMMLIGCANLANLVLARGATRVREMALRAALGASRGRILYQFLTESLLLAGAGTAAGIVVGWLGLCAVAASLPADGPLWLRLDIDPTVMGFAVLLMLVTTVVFGLVPALRASRPNLREGISESGDHTGSGRVGRVQGALVVVEVALAVVLLVCTGLMTRAVLGLLMTEPGFRSENVITMRVPLPRAPYSSPDSLRQFYTSFLDGVRQIPGVQQAGAGTRLPSHQANWVPMIIPENTMARSATGRFPAHAVVVTPGYFESLGIKRVHGRLFAPQDRGLDSPGSVIVNRTFVERHWPGADPLGHRLKYWLGPDNQSEWLTVVGVVDDVLNGKGNAPLTTYYPLEQIPRRTLTLVVKASSDEAALVPAIRQQLARMDGSLPLSDVRTMEAVVDEFLWMPRLTARLFAVFGLLALVLAAIGVCRSSPDSGVGPMSGPTAAPRSGGRRGASRRQSLRVRTSGFCPAVPRHTRGGSCERRLGGARARRPSPRP
jgi:predicted permease